MKLQRPKEAFTLALQLAITAPSEKLALGCFEMAHILEEKLTPSEIEECTQIAKRYAEELLKQ